MSPFEKWKVYGRPPWKCIMSFLLVVLTTSQVWSLNRFIMPYLRASKEDWPVYVVEPDIYADPYEVGGETTFQIYEISWLVKQVKYSVQQYYNIENGMVGNFEMPRYPNGEFIPPLLTVEVFVNGVNEFDQDAELEKQTFNLTVDDYGPFSELDNTELSHYIQATSHFSIDFSVRNILNFKQVLGYDSCYWNGVTQKYSFKWRGRIDLSVSLSIKICEEEFHKNWYNREICTNIILIILTLLSAIVSEILLIKSVYRHIMLFRRAKQTNEDMQYCEWNDLKWKDKLDFFNLWFFISTTANILIFFAAAFCLGMFLGTSSVDSTWKAPLAFTGLACALSWFALVQFFEHFPNFYSLILTLRISAPKVLRYFLGAVPVFLGFAMFGVAMFSSYSEMFADLGAASVTLFAVLNGDVIHDVFKACLPAGPLISRAYLYCFICMFIYAVLNIFIAIVEDSYFSAKPKSKKPEDLKVVGLLHKRFIPNNLQDHTSKMTSSQKQQQLMEVLGGMHGALNEEFLKRVHTIVSNTSVPVRPAHNPNYFPCDFEDCIHCLLRLVYLESLEAIKTSVQKEVERVKVGGKIITGND